MGDFVNFLSLKYKALFFILFIFFSPLNVYADNIALNIKPHKCVALHQGQVCYQKISVAWYSKNQQETAEEYCLYIKNNAEAEYCASESSGYVYQFSGKSDTVFELKNSAGEIVASRDIKVVSVYKGRRRSTTGWRLF